jgi:hypothetical protein
VEEVLYKRRRRGYANLVSLIAFLRAELGEDDHQPTNEDSHSRDLD